MADGLMAWLLHGRMYLQVGLAWLLACLVLGLGHLLGLCTARQQYCVRVCVPTPACSVTRH